jgi:hypothetical protein
MEWNHHHGNTDRVCHSVNQNTCMSRVEFHSIIGEKAASLRKLTHDSQRKKIHEVISLNTFNMVYFYHSRSGIMRSK